MRSSLAKVLHRLGGRSLVGHSLAAVAGVQPDRTVVVVGHQRDQVEAELARVAPDVTIAVQAEQRGTGHAVQVGLDALDPADRGSGTVLVTYGDVPLLRAETLAALLADHRAHARAVTILTARPANPHGYGRILRDDRGAVIAIREQKDATPAEAEVGEVNSGILAVDAAFCDRAVRSLDTGNSQGEYYLTDIVARAVSEGLVVGALVIDDAHEAEGVNDRVQLAAAARRLNERLTHAALLAGVTIVDPATTWLDVEVELEPDVTLLPGTALHGRTRVAGGATIGPDTTLTDVTVGACATVIRTHGSEAEIGPATTVGPFAYLRPGTVTGTAAKIGTFVEVKNSHLADGAKVPHLSYVGDADIGEHTNIGAGTITANYDGVAKHRTSVGAHARTGSDNVFVAPVTIGDGAYTGAGTTVRDDVPSGALAVGGGEQRTIEGWVEAKRPGTPAAEAARRAQESTGE